jgi:hypothetical protein
MDGLDAQQLRRHAGRLEQLLLAQAGTLRKKALESRSAKVAAVNSTATEPTTCARYCFSLAEATSAQNPSARFLRKQLLLHLAFSSCALHLVKQYLVRLASLFFSESLETASPSHLIICVRLCCRSSFLFNF